MLFDRLPDWARRDDGLHTTLWRLAGGQGEHGTPAGSWSPATLRRLLALARIHGVLGIVLARLPALARSQPEIWDLADKVRRGEIVQSLRVRRHTEWVMQRLGWFGIPAVVVGGIDFADALPEEPRLRPTFSVEILVARERWPDAACVLAALGHVEAPGQPALHRRAGLHGHRSWRHGDLAPIDVTLHWNLVPHPDFRGQASVELVHLDRDADGSPTPASRLVIAAAQAAYRHRFDRLFLVTDLGAAVRRMQAPDVRALAALVGRTGTSVAVDAALAITHRFLGDPAPEELRRALFATASPAISAVVLSGVRDSLSAIRTPLLSAGRRRLRDWLLHARPLVAEGD